MVVHTKRKRTTRRKRGGKPFLFSSKPKSVRTKLTKKTSGQIAPTTKKQAMTDQSTINQLQQALKDLRANRKHKETFRRILLEKVLVAYHTTAEKHEALVVICKGYKLRHPSTASDAELCERIRKHMNSSTVWFKMSGVLGTVAVLAAVAMRHTPHMSVSEVIGGLFTSDTDGDDITKTISDLKTTLPVATVLPMLLGTLIDTPRETVIRNVATQKTRKNRGGGVCY